MLLITYSQCAYTHLRLTHQLNTLEFSDQISKAYLKKKKEDRNEGEKESAWLSEQTDKELVRARTHTRNLNSFLKTGLNITMQKKKDGKKQKEEEKKGEEEEFAFCKTGGYLYPDPDSTCLYALFKHLLQQGQSSHPGTLMKCWLQYHLNS